MYHDIAAGEPAGITAVSRVTVPFASGETPNRKGSVPPLRPVDFVSFPQATNTSARASRTSIFGSLISSNLSNELSRLFLPHERSKFQSNPRGSARLRLSARPGCADPSENQQEAILPGGRKE